MNTMIDEHSIKLDTLDISPAAAYCADVSS